MTAKMTAAWMAAQQGCTTVIANGKTANSILHVSGCPLYADNRVICLLLHRISCTEKENAIPALLLI